MEDSINPEHYKCHKSGIECITIAQEFSYNIGSAIKYLWRHGKKQDAIEDLKKAIVYINFEIERIKKDG